MCDSKNKHYETNDIIRCDFFFLQWLFYNIIIMYELKVKIKRAKRSPSVVIIYVLITLRIIRITELYVHSRWNNYYSKKMSFLKFIFSFWNASLVRLYEVDWQPFPVPTPTNHTAFQDVNQTQRWGIVPQHVTYITRKTRTKWMKFFE